MPEYLTTRQLSEMLQLSETTLYRMRQNNTLPPSVIIGERSRRWRREAVEQWLQERDEVAKQIIE